MSDFLWEFLIAANPLESSGKEISVVEALEKAASNLKNESQQTPKQTGPLQFALAQSYLYLGELRRAESHALKAQSIWKDTLGPDASNTLDTIALLSRIYLAQGHVQQAIESAKKIFSYEKKYLEAIILKLFQLLKFLRLSI